MIYERGYQRSINNLTELCEAAESLFVYRGVTEQPVYRAYIELLHILAAKESSLAEAVRVYKKLFYLLAEAREMSADMPGDAWQNYLIESVLMDENPFSRKAEFVPVSGMGESLLKAVKSDLSILRELSCLNAGQVLKTMEQRFGAAPENSLVIRKLPAWDGFKGLSSPYQEKRDLKEGIKALLLSGDWPAQLEQLASCYQRFGTGLLSRYCAYRWVNNEGQWRLEGIEETDPVALEHIIGYDRELETIVKNTKSFLGGHPANNVLLYGDRGTGKSSAIKAVFNKFSEQGLKLIEMPKESLADYTKIISILRNRSGYFILFIDDLSFEEQEVEYKNLKSILEGCIETKPPNVLLYATSNRRHLVKEYFADRFDDGEIHSGDSIQEKLSLSDRFGITITFSTPNQALYLEIVEGIARMDGLQVASGELRARALQWAAWHNGLSGRTARQFINHLKGELG
jgi:uncharacterized protein